MSDRKPNLIQNLPVLGLACAFIVATILILAGNRPLLAAVFCAGPLLAALVAAVDGPVGFKRPSSLFVAGSCGAWGLMWCWAFPGVGTFVSLAIVITFAFLIGKEIRRPEDGGRQ